MKSLLLCFACLAALALCTQPVVAASSPKSDLQTLVQKIKAKIAKGENTETALAPEIAEFDALLTKYSANKSEDVAQILAMKASLYGQVLKNGERATALYQQLKTDFPGTEAASKADAAITSLKRQEASLKIQQSLAIGTKFPEFSEPDVNGRTVSLADYKGKVVLIDFWATWCGPCVAELPNVLKAYEKHHAQGFEIIGVSLDRSDARQKLLSFTKERKMPWAQIYDGKYWQSKLAVKHGVNSIPATYLLDREGNIVGKNLRGAALEKEVAKLVAAAP